MVRIRLILAFVILLLGSTIASAQSVNLAWDASTDPSVTGYVVKWGTRTSTYTSSIDVGNRTNWTVSGLTPDQKYYFVVTSYAEDGDLRQYISKNFDNFSLQRKITTLRDIASGLVTHS